MIEFQGTTKTYRNLVPSRAVHALHDLTLSVKRGEVFGIAGPNGAGKTTMLGLAMGFLRPTGGSITVDGLAPRRFVETCGVAYVSEITSVPGWWTVAGALARYAVLAGVPTADRGTRVAQTIERLGLGEQRTKRVRQLSKGNLQRLGIAQALLSDSPFVVLDEPTHGLDPVWTQRFRDIVADLRGPDRTILIASHNLDELERLTDRVAILDRGTLSRIADAHQTDGTAPTVYRLVVDAAHERVLAAFPDAERVEHAKEVSYHVRGTLPDLNRGLQAILQAGVQIRAFFPARSRLEEAFRAAVGESQ